MKVLDLFSGIGGFSVGLERAGFETVAFCEIEEYPRSVLKKHCTDVPVYGDIKQLTATQLEQMELFPNSFAVASHVSLSASQVVKEANKTKDTSYQRCLDLYESANLDGSLARMLLDSLNLVSTRYSLHWKLKATPLGRLLFQRSRSMRRTKETGSDYCTRRRRKGTRWLPA